MKLRTKLKLFAFLIIAALAITLALVLIPPPAKTAMPGLTILDSRLQLTQCRISYGMEHRSDQHPLATTLRRKILVLKARLLHRPPPIFAGSVFGDTFTNSLTLVLTYNWNSNPTNLAVEMLDTATNHYRTLDHGHSWVSDQVTTVGSGIYAVQCPTPPPPGDYEFQILLGSNGPPVAKYKTTLNLK